MAGNSDRYVIRELKEDEVRKFFDMLLEFADYINARETVSNTQDALHRDLFGDTKRCYCLVAERIEDGVLAGYSLYFPGYSLFKGAILHINHLFVREQYRGNGVGTLLYKAVAKKAIDQDCQALDLLVHQSNKKAMEFYERMGAFNQTEGVGRHRMRLTRKRMKDLVKT